MGNEGDINIFNPQKEVSKEITLDVLIRHRDAMKQARTGTIVDEEKMPSDNDKKFNQVRALTLIIASQREMITISRPNIYFRSYQKWKKSHKSDEDRIEKPFKEFKCDYSQLMYWLGFLKACHQDIIQADISKTLADDYILEVESSVDGAKTYRLTPNFFDMLDEIETSYEQIYLLMLTNKIVSAGIEEDEELTYKQKEAEAIRRVVEA